MAKILIVEDSPDQATMIAALLDRAGHTTSTAENGRAGLSALATELPDLVITDLIMPELDGLGLVEEVRELYAPLPVILMTAHGSAEIAMQALRKGAASYVPKSEITTRLLDTAADVLNLARSEQKRRQLLSSLVESKSCFVLENDTSLALPLVNHVQETAAGRRGGVDETQLMQVGLSLHEALCNAIRHGNLGLTSQMLHESGEDHGEVVAKRLADPKYADRRVYVMAQISPSEVKLVIRDEGDGFELAQVPDPTEPANMVRAHGRGLYLIGTFMDVVRHNETGNEITMIKRLDPPGNQEDSRHGA